MRLTIVCKTAQRFAAPVLADVGEEPVLDLVPLAGSRWEVTHRDSQPGFVGQLLQLHVSKAATENRYYHPRRQ